MATQQIVSRSDTGTKRKIDQPDKNTKLNDILVHTHVTHERKQQRIVLKNNLLFVVTIRSGVRLKDAMTASVSDK